VAEDPAVPFCASTGTVKNNAQKHDKTSHRNRLCTFMRFLPNIGLPNFKPSNRSLTAAAPLCQYLSKLQSGCHVGLCVEQPDRFAFEDKRGEPAGGIGARVDSDTVLPSDDIFRRRVPMHDDLSEIAA